MADGMVSGKISDKIVALRTTWHAKNHPIYVGFAQGKVPLRALGLLMAQHYQFVTRVMPSFGLAYYNAPDELRRLHLENLAEEEGLIAGDGEGRHAIRHTDLIVRFCKAAGLTEDEVLKTEQLPAWRARTYFYITTMRDQPPGVVVAMQSTSEGQEPGIHKECTIPGLIKHHGFKEDSPEIEFFTEHLVADTEHSGRQLALAERLCNTPELQARALEVCETLLKTRWASFNDLYRTAVLGHRDPMPAGIAA